MLLNKVVLEYIPKYGHLPAGRQGGLADEVRKWGDWIKQEAEKELAEFYPCLPAGRPKDPDLPVRQAGDATSGKFYAYVLRCSDGSLYKGQTDNLPRRFKQHCDGLVEWTKRHLPVDLIHVEAFDTREQSAEREKWLKSGVGREWLAQQFPKETPIAYLWARTIQCEGPGCGAEVPLIRSLWLAKKAGRSKMLKLVPDRINRRVEFELLDNPKISEIGSGTVARGSATCPFCGYTTRVGSVRTQLKARRGGAGDARLLAVVTTRPGQSGRFYRLPFAADLEATKRAAVELARRQAAHSGIISIVPDELISFNELRRISVPIYGMERWGDLFSPRQALALSTLARLVEETGLRIAETEEPGFAAAV